MSLSFIIILNLFFLFLLSLTVFVSKEIKKGKEELSNGYLAVIGTSLVYICILMVDISYFLF